MNTQNTDVTETDIVDDELDLDQDDAELEDDWTPPTREDWEKLIADKKKADAQAADRKRKLRELGYDARGNKVATSTQEDDESGSESRPGVSRKAAIRLATSATSALVEAGVSPKAIDRALKLLDLDSVDEHDDIAEQLAEQIADLKADIPDLFRRQRVNNVANAATVGTGKKQVSTSSETKTWQDEVRERFAKGLI